MELNLNVKSAAWFQYLWTILILTFIKSKTLNRTWNLVVNVKEYKIKDNKERRRLTNKSTKEKNNKENKVLLETWMIRNIQECCKS